MQILTYAGGHFEFSVLHKSCYFCADSSKKHGHHVTLKILIGRFSRNFFSRTAEGIELKYVTKLSNFIFGVLTPLSAIVQLYHGDQF
jgi:hypothetical protein